MKIATVEEMRAMDRTAMERFSIPELLLMENAGLAAHRVLAETVGVSGRRFLVVCGPGNNGGDGFVIARKILSDGGAPRVVLLADPGRYRGAAAANFGMLAPLGIPVETKPAPDRMARLLGEADGVVDAILGTGISKPVTGAFADAIERINGSGLPVLSVDIPSGVCGDTGRALGAAVQAEATVAFGLPKVGNLLYPGFAHGGRLYVTHISFPPELTRAGNLRIAVNTPPALPERCPWGHKGSFGDGLFIAGARAYFGAPLLAAMAFLKAGGGYARLAAPAGITPFVSVHGREIVYLPQEETPAGSIAASNRSRLLEAAGRSTVTVIGPGLSLDEETQGLVRDLAAAIDAPLVIDGDAITAVSRNPELIRGRTAPTVLTPHPGEMARLAGRTPRQVLEDPVGVLQDRAEALGATIVLKGAHSLIGTSDRRVRVNLSGNCGMATAGAGDVLTGAVAAMHGLGLAFGDAVAKGVFLHGVAGDIAAEAGGPDGMTASDILEALPEALRRDRGGAGPPPYPYGGPIVV
jgi:NAD(P)H-hydrate epimerase